MAFVQVEGRVDFAKRGGKGYTVVEEWEVQGQARKRRWAVWFETETALEVGTVVKLSGVLGTKVGDPWTDREGVERPGGVEHSLNRARVQGAPVSQADDAWPETEVPF